MQIFQPQVMPAWRVLWMRPWPVDLGEICQTSLDILDASPTVLFILDESSQKWKIIRNIQTSSCSECSIAAWSRWFFPVLWAFSVQTPGRIPARSPIVLTFFSCAIQGYSWTVWLVICLNYELYTHIWNSWWLKMLKAAASAGQTLAVGERHHFLTIQHHHKQSGGSAARCRTHSKLVLHTSYFQDCSA